MKKSVALGLPCIISSVLVIASSLVVRPGDSAIDFEKGWPFKVQNFSTDGVGGPVVYSDWFDQVNFFYNFAFFLVITAVLMAAYLELLRLIRRRK